MSLTAFLDDLLSDGCATLTRPVPVDADDRAAAAEVLRNFEQQWRLEFPGDPPDLVISAALWAAEMLFHACECLMFREIDEDGIYDLLGLTYSGARTAAEHYSVDLTFQLLPDVTVRAENISGEDPLLAFLRKWACQWPLSSVGMAGIEPVGLEAVLGHAGLRRVYVDRVLERNDHSRLHDPQVVAEIRTVLGVHSELAPKMWELLGTARSKDNDA